MCFLPHHSATVTIHISYASSKVLSMPSNRRKIKLIRIFEYPSYSIQAGFTPGNKSRCPSDTEYHWDCAGRISMTWLSYIASTKNPHILVALHRITNSQHAVLETSFQWADCAHGADREIPSSHQQRIRSL